MSKIGGNIVRNVAQFDYNVIYLPFDQLYAINC